jgi:hypothetical protein
MVYPRVSKNYSVMYLNLMWLTHCLVNIHTVALNNVSISVGSCFDIRYILLKQKLRIYLSAYRPYRTGLQNFPRIFCSC